ncbi:MAG: SH3 domain-containing protein [Clostridia bacterium]|nr:SH3 domain-containing protein [Clostridia bacterium]
MKKRILALLLAGLITASFASCVASGDQENPDNDTEAEQTQGESTTPDDGTESTPDVTEWTSVDETVFTVSQVSLREDPDTSGDIVKALAKETQLHRTRVSENWSYVETTSGEKGYVSNRYITSVNILGTDFTTIAGGEKIMYATDVVNVRLYPSADDFSDKKGSYSKDDEVTVVATNGKWYRVKFKTNSDGSVEYYYVNASYLSEEKGGTSIDMSQYESLFAPLTEEKVMYADGKVNIRTSPVVTEDGSNLITTLKSGAKVTVTKEGTVDGQKWYYAKAEIAPEKEGDPSKKVEGYITASYLTDETSPESMTLDELIVRYPTFSKLTKTVYVVKDKSLKVRSTPEYLEDDSNYVDTL